MSFVKKWKEAHFFEVSNKVAQEVFNDFEQITALSDEKEDQKEKLTSVYKDLKVLSKECRDLLKTLGKNAKVEVEPDLLTYVLDEINKQSEEVVYSVCPGAGGYDAACLISTQDLSEEKLNKILQNISAKLKEKGTFT